SRVRSDLIIPKSVRKRSASSRLGDCSRAYARSVTFTIGIVHPQADANPTGIVAVRSSCSWQRCPRRIAARFANKDAPIIAGHYHLNASNIDAHMKFWVDTLGGKPMKFGPQQVDVVE